MSDFGLARRLEQGQSSFAPTANNLAGSLGWRAPECIRGQVKLNEGFERASSCSSSSSSSSLLDLVMTEEDGIRGRPHRLTKAVDLFALGCLYFWVLLSGEHPFGETYNRESNIVKGDWVNMGMLEILGEEGWEAKDLIGRLLSPNSEDRWVFFPWVKADDPVRIRLNVCHILSSGHRPNDYLFCAMHRIDSRSWSLNLLNLLWSCSRRMLSRWLARIGTIGSTRCLSII